MANRSTLLATLQAYLIEATDARAVQLMWQADGVTQSLFTAQPTLRVPTPAEWLQLAAGQIVSGGTFVYLPMIVVGDLRGWVALQTDTVDAPVLDVVTQAGMALALLERQNYQTTVSRELAVMDKVGRILSTTLQLDRLLPSLATVVRELVVAHDFYIALVDEEAQELYFAYLSSRNGTRPPYERWSIDTGLTGQIIRSGTPIMTDDYLAECERRNIRVNGPDDMHFSRAWLGVPLCHHDRVLGVMVAGIDDPHIQYTDADMYVLSSVAAQAAVAVANAQLYRRVHEQADQLALINRIGRTISATLDLQQVPMLIMGELQTALDVEDGAVLIEDAPTGDLVVRYTLQPKMGLRIPRGVGVAGDTLRRGTVQIVHDMRRDQRVFAPLDIDGPIPTRSMICAPLRGRQQLRGVIQLRNKRGGPFTAADAQLLEAIAEQAAVALENAELYTHTDSALNAHVADLEQRNQQLTNIVAISNALRSTTDVFELGQQIVATVQQLTGSQRVVVGLVDVERQRVRAVAQAGLNPRMVTARPELWTPVAAAKEMLRGATPIGSVAYRVEQHELAREFNDALVLTLLDTNGTLVGVIGLDTGHAPDGLSHALLNELEIVANQAAIAIVNARLANDQEQTVDRLTALNALSLTVTTTQLSTDEILGMTLRGAIGTTNAIGGGWRVWGRDGIERRTVLGFPADADIDLLPLLDGLDGEYGEFGTDNAAPTLRAAGIETVIAVPVRGAKTTLGALWLGYTEDGVARGEREMAVLYAKTAGAVLENLRLFDQVSTAHDRLASILASTAEGMIMATAQGRIAVANEAFGQLLGLAPETLEGRSIFDVCKYPALAADQAQIEPICEALLHVAQGRAAQSEGEIRLTGAPRELAWSVVPVRGASATGAALLVLRDITAERQAEKLRQDLANMIVHDLRSPLTNMMVSTDLLLKQTSGPLTDAQRRIVTIAGDSTQQMLDLVNGLLDIRRLEQRQLELQRQPVDLFDVVEGVFERLDRVATDRAVQLHNETATIPPVRADPDLLRRVVQNLVDNATKFSPRGGDVRVYGSTATDSLPPDHAAGRWVVLHVADRGPGVPDSYRSVIFELFGQAPTGRGQGTGLGLAFCKMAIAAHGGMIWVEDAPDGGALFKFTLPLL